MMILRCFSSNLLSVFIVVSLVFPVKVTWAERSAEDIQYAQEMIQRGQALLKKKQYRAAISYFERSQARVPELNNLFMIGAIYTKLKDCPLALKYWTEAQERCGRCALSEKLDTAIIKHTSTCSVDISVQSLPRAQVSIDGRTFGETPYLGRVLNGTHKITLSAVGHQSQTVRAQAASGRPINIDVTLQPAGSLLGVQSPNLGRPTEETVQPQTSFRQPSKLIAPGATMPAETWLAAEEAAGDKSSKYKTLKTTLMITGLVLGMSSLGIFAYTQLKYESLSESAKSSKTMNQALANEAQGAATLQVTGRLVAGLSAVSLAVSFFAF